MTMTELQIGQFVDDLYAATDAGDWATAATMLTEDFFITEADTLPMAGVYRGRNALRELFEKVMGIMDVAGLDRVQTTVGGNYAVCILSLRFADPALTPASLCELFRFRDGKLCEIRPYYFDSANIIDACAAKQRTGNRRTAAYATAPNGELRVFPSLAQSWTIELTR